MFFSGLFRIFVAMFTATIGFFDGVHLGHRFLIDQLRKLATLRGEQSMAVTFDVHPRQVVRADYVPHLLTLKDEKERLLQETGVDRVVVLNFTKAMSMMTSQEFMQMLHDDYDVDALLMGYDHSFGHDSGSPEDYKERGRAAGVEVHCAAELEEPKVSSRVIRNLIADGKMTAANELLGHMFTVTAPVVHGHEIGRQLGFPTANVAWPAQKILPEEGVYAGWATLPDGTRMKAMVNIGSRPTIGNGEELSVEVHLLRFDGQLYGLPLTVEFAGKLRDEISFPDKESLARQLRMDAAAVEQSL